MARGSTSTYARCGRTAYLSARKRGLPKRIYLRAMASCIHAEGLYRGTWRQMSVHLVHNATLATLDRQHNAISLSYILFLTFMIIQNYCIYLLINRSPPFSAQNTFANFSVTVLLNIFLKFHFQHTQFLK